MSSQQESSHRTRGGRVGAKIRYFNPIFQDELNQGKAVLGDKSQVSN